MLLSAGVPVQLESALSSLIHSVSAGRWGPSLTQKIPEVMNNGTGSLFLKACHKASAFSGILLEHEKLCRSLTKGGIGGGRGLLLGSCCFTGGKCPVK